MNKIDLIFQKTGLKYKPESVEAFCLMVLNMLDIEDWEFSIVICDDDYIRKYNAEYRNRDEATDVLTFRNADTDWMEIPEILQNDDGAGYYAGDMLISVETLDKNAAYFSVNVDEEFKRLLIHGILHLSGLDHESNSENEKMLIKQEEILKETGDYLF